MEDEAGAGQMQQSGQDLASWKCLSYIYCMQVCLCGQTLSGSCGDARFSVHMNHYISTLCVCFYVFVFVFVCVCVCVCHCLCMCLCVCLCLCLHLCLYLCHFFTLCLYLCLVTVSICVHVNTCHESRSVV